MSENNELPSNSTNRSSPAEDQQQSSDTSLSLLSDDVKDERSLKKRRLLETDSIAVPTTSREDSSQHFPLWVAGGSPAKFVAVDELLSMSVAMDNLALVHEIAIDPNFSVSDIPVNPIEAAVKENMHRAYWDLLREDLQKDPPDYSHALNLLLEIKQTILNDMLTSRHIRFKADVNLILDENSLRNKLEQGCLDVRATGQFIVGLLARLCAPERDTIVDKLRTEDNVVSLIKGIFELMDLMKNDLANYTLSQNRATVEEYSAKFEFEQFQKYLEHFPEGTRFTKDWLESAYNETYTNSVDNSQPETKRERTITHEESDILMRTTSKGYVKLIQQQNPSPFPETLRIDRLRLTALAEKFLQMTVTTSAVFLTCNLAGKLVSESDGFKKTLKDYLIVITNDIDESNIVDKLYAVSEQCVHEVRVRSTTLGISFPEDREKLLRSQLESIVDKGNAVRSLVFSRLTHFVEEILCSPSEVTRLMPGLSVIQNELFAFTARLLRICIHNRKTFFKLYENLLLDIKTTTG